MSKEFFNAYDIADMFGICYAKALEWIKYSGVSYIKVGRTYHVKATEFDKFTSSGVNIS